MRFKCKRCGSCCTDFVPLRPGELEKIADFVRQHRIKNKQKGTENCPFLRRNRCAIYEVRPTVCRVYDCKARTEQMVERIRNSCRDAVPTSFVHELFPEDEYHITLCEDCAECVVHYDEDIPDDEPPRSA